MKSYTLFNADVHSFPLVVSLPHSGTYVSAEMKAALLPDAVLTNVDWFLRELYSFLQPLDVTMIQNNVCRYVADPNRAADQTDAAGYYAKNVIYQKNTFGTPLYPQPLSISVQEERLRQFYLPYHAELERLLAEKISVFGNVLLIDLHSFALYPQDPKNRQPADFVLGNNWDQTASKQLRKQLTQLLADQGYTTSDNYPFSGGYITKHYGAKAKITALQLEIRYNQYIKERHFGEEVLSGWDEQLFLTAQKRLQHVFTNFLATL